MPARKAEIERMVTLLDNWRRELEASKDLEVKALGKSLSDAHRQLELVVICWPNGYGRVVSAHSKPIVSDNK